MGISERMSNLCGRQNKAGRGVFPPQVCVYCFGCPIATLVVGTIAGDPGPAPAQAKPIPAGYEAEVTAWLNAIEAGLNERLAR